MPGSSICKISRQQGTLRNVDIVLKLVREAWRGQRSLAKVFWFYFVLPSALLLGFLYLLGGGIRGIVGYVILLAVTVYLSWCIVSVLRSARDAGRPIRYLARITIIVFGYFVLEITNSWTYTRAGHYITVRPKVMEVVSVSAPARTALGVVCSEGGWVAGLDNSKLGLEPPEQYAGHYVTSVTAAGTSTTEGTVTSVLKEIPIEPRAFERLLFIKTGIRAGATVTYTARCDSGGTTWSISGSESVPDRYLPTISE